MRHGVVSGDGVGIAYSFVWFGVSFLGQEPGDVWEPGGRRNVAFLRVLNACHLNDSSP